MLAEMDCSSIDVQLKELIDFQLTTLSVCLKIAAIILLRAVEAFSYWAKKYFFHQIL